MYNNFDFETYRLFNKMLLLVVSFLSLWIGSLVYFNNPSKKQNKLFFLMSVFIILWPTFGYLTYFSTNSINAIFWAKLAYASVSLFVIICYFFFIYFLKEEKMFRVFNIFVLLTGTIFVLLSLFSDFIIKDVIIQNVGVSPVFSLGAYFFYFFVFVIFSFLIYRLNISYYILPKKEKIRIQYFFIGTSIFLLLNIIFNIVLPILQNSFKHHQFGNYAAIFLLAFTAYAIVKHELLGIKTLITQILIVIISIILLVDVFLLSDDFTMQLVKMGILITFLYFSMELVKSVRKEKEAVEELKKAYRKINHYTKQLEKSNKKLEEANQRFKELLEMKNEFLHITSHQLRTPLTAIRGMLSMWYEGDFEDLPKREKSKMLKRILASADRLNNITNDMLDALELEGGFLKFQFKPVSIVKIIKETTNTLKPNFDKKNIYIKLETDLKVSDVEVEPNYIRQVFMNVIDNACKYTKKGGVSINIKKDNKYIKVIIKDTGIGISKVDQKKIFEKFTRGRNAISENASGSGLGLFIARKIVNEHGGKIEIESEGVGRGSTVKIYLKIKHGK